MIPNPPIEGLIPNLLSQRYNTTIASQYSNLLPMNNGYHITSDSLSQTSSEQNRKPRFHLSDTSTGVTSHNSYALSRMSQNMSNRMSQIILDHRHHPMVVQSPSIYDRRMSVTPIQDYLMVNKPQRIQYHQFPYHSSRNQLDSSATLFSSVDGSRISELSKSGFETRNFDTCGSRIKRADFISINEQILYDNQRRRESIEKTDIAIRETGNYRSLWDLSGYPKGIYSKRYIHDGLEQGENLINNHDQENVKLAMNRGSMKEFPENKSRDEKKVKKKVPELSMNEVPKRFYTNGINDSLCSITKPQDIKTSLIERQQMEVISKYSKNVKQSVKSRNRPSTTQALLIPTKTDTLKKETISMSERNQLRKSLQEKNIRKIDDTFQKEDRRNKQRNTSTETKNISNLKNEKMETIWFEKSCYRPMKCNIETDITDKDPTIISSVKQAIQQNSVTEPNSKSYEVEHSKSMIHRIKQSRGGILEMVLERLIGLPQEVSEFSKVYVDVSSPNGTLRQSEIWDCMAFGTAKHLGL